MVKNVCNEIIAGNVKAALTDVNSNIVKLNSIQDSLRRNSTVISHLVCDLADIHENIKHDNLDSYIPEIEKINNQLRVLAEARAYMVRFEKIAEGNIE